MKVTQWIAIGVSAALVCILYFFGRTTYLKSGERKQLAAGSAQNSEATTQAFRFSDYIDQQKQTLTPEQRESLTTLPDTVKQGSSDTSFLREWKRKGALWESFRQPAISGFYLEKIARQQQTAPNWVAAGDAYLKAIRTGSDTMRQRWANKAISNYRKALALDSHQTNVKIKLATAYTRGTEDVMKGVQLLLDVVEKDSTHIPANYHLARLALRSGQTDKAIMRLQRILRHRPAHLGATLLLGRAYLQGGQKEKAVKTLRESKKMLNDEQKRAKLDQYIDKIINS